MIYNYSSGASGGGGGDLWQTGEGKGKGTFCALEVEEMRICMVSYVVVVQMGTCRVSFQVVVVRKLKLLEIGPYPKM